MKYSDLAGFAHAADLPHGFVQSQPNIAIILVDHGINCAAPTIRIHFTLVNQTRSKHIPASLPLQFATQSLTHIFVLSTKHEK